MQSLLVPSSDTLFGRKSPVSSTAAQKFLLSIELVEGSFGVEGQPLPLAFDPSCLCFLLFVSRAFYTLLALLLLTFLLLSSLLHFRSFHKLCALASPSFHLCSLIPDSPAVLALSRHFCPLLCLHLSPSLLDSLFCKSLLSPSFALNFVDFS